MADSRTGKDSAAAGRAWKERLAKAYVFLTTARTCLEQQDWDTATSRAYYAAFHAAAAFLEQHPAHPKKAPDEGRNEKEIRSGLSRHFRTTVKGGKRMHKVLEDLLGERVAADYRAASVGERRARQSVNNAREFIREINDELVRQGAIVP